MSLELAYTKPKPIEVRARESHVYIETYSLTIAAFIESAKKVFVGETKRWPMPQSGRGTRELPMCVIFKNHLIESIVLGEHEISFSDFLILTEYVLTNTNLDKDDPRVPFITFINAIDHTRSYMETSDWERFVERVSTLKAANGYPSFTYGKRTNPRATRLANQCT